MDTLIRLTVVYPSGRIFRGSYVSLIEAVRWGEFFEMFGGSAEVSS